jgi:diacylglycerol kinase (ATP)
MPQTALPRYVLISVNMKAGRKSPRIRAERLKAALEQRGLEVELHTSLDEVSQRANELFKDDRLQALVGVGGDGTAAELTNRTIPGVPITLLPSGTANLIAKHLKLPFNPEKSAEMIANGATISFDAGKANGRLFLVMVSAGIDADIVRLVHAAREESYRKKTKKGAHISYLSYIKPIFKSIKTYKYPQIETEFASDANSEATSTILGKWSFVFNLPRYGWGLPLVPKCTGVDKRLDYCIFQGGKLWTALFSVACAQLGSMHRLLPNAKLGQGVRFKITAASDEPNLPAIPYQLDGDPGGYLPLEIETIPNRFTALGPKKIVERLEKKRVQ